ncbi:hypothetical protein E3P81_03277 [Wallemia ichthyophaga]|nr:hypothetical protein E3P97_03342 [Wallemia ichthyophaga]TIB02978.1 hypothetical protein E3P96_02018 [Wallemia ichthyophaga]TIB28512.1 hypothetical protein E3P85_03632 [Wallemia ichthyophaga]TIB44866.1 hypothetical protein E3P82_03310 [Wallemia ichthyophaga]TIB47406.1 hypothetical protein E3P81_03277 [Wallemia ichthyophaga]
MSDITIGDYLRKEKYSAAFINNYLIPMSAAIWSTPPDSVALDFPASTLIRFMHNHHLLQIADRTQWLTIKGGSKYYVNEIIKNMKEGTTHLSTPISSLRRLHNGTVELSTANEDKWFFDHVILATHADTSMSIINEDLSEKEKGLLSNFKFSSNEAVLHYDEKLMPTRREAWTSWNFLSNVDEKSNVNNQVSLTYWMNLLQSLSEENYGNVLVTLNPPLEPREDCVIGRWSYEHPLISADAVQAQGPMNDIQGKDGLSFAGAWLKYGFHEDGFISGYNAVKTINGLTVAAPFDLISPERQVDQVNAQVRFMLYILQYLRMNKVLISFVVIIASVYLSID